VPILKPISGHTSCAGVYRYLTKNGRALAHDFLNIDAPEEGSFDWAAVMDETRHAYRNDTPWGDRPARTYKHYVISPDPGDSASLEELRDLAVAWAKENFPDYEVAIVYHDDNAGRIPHAHVVVNNTNLATGRRLQDPDPRTLKHNLQALAKGRGLSDLDTQEGDRFGGRVPPRTMQHDYVRRAERDLEAEGRYSWVADIRGRVGIARSIARSEGEFRSVLSAIGIEVADNSAKAPRRDWVYSLEGHPTWRISGERMGLGYGREALVRSFSLGAAGHLSDASEGRIYEIARSAYEVGDLAGLKRLSDSVAAIGRSAASSRNALERIGQADPDLAAYIRESGILDAGRAERPRSAPAPDTSFPETPAPKWRVGGGDEPRPGETREREGGKRGRQR
jgi:hypothetical protein